MPGVFFSPVLRLVTLSNGGGISTMLRCAELMNYLMSDFAQGTKLGIYEDVGLPIIGTADFQKFAYFGQWLGIVQKWPMRLALDALPDLFGR